MHLIHPYSKLTKEKHSMFSWYPNFFLKGKLADPDTGNKFGSNEMVAGHSIAKLFIA